MVGALGSWFYRKPALKNLNATKLGLFFFSTSAELKGTRGPWVQSFFGLPIDNGALKWRLDKGLPTEAWGTQGDTAPS